MKKLIIILCLSGAGLKNYAQTDYVAIQDTRTVNNVPTDFKARLALDFKDNSVIGMHNGGYYSAVLTVAPWQDFTGGKNHQLSFNDGGIFYRTGSHLAPTWESWRRLLIEDDNGNVGIGTASPTQKLSVNGNIRAREVKVENANWPDFVFAKDYHLPTLLETEKYIKEKGHLPGIPCAVDVRTNGVDLGDMNAKLLQKIEELTLHLIEKGKQISSLQEKDRMNQIRVIRENRLLNDLIQRIEILERKKNEE